MPTVQPVEVISSLAHRQGDDIRVLLHLPGANVPPSPTVPVRFKNGEHRFTRHATVRAADPGGLVLELAVPAKRFGRGIWSLAFRPHEGVPFERIEARLLTGDRQPISLIPGPVPDTRLAPPSPAANRASGRGRRLVTKLVTRTRRRLRS